MKEKARAVIGTTQQRPVFLDSTMNGIDDDSPWDADPNPSYVHQSEWSKITSEFTNVC